MISSRTTDPCKISASAPTEQFIPDHIFIYLASGTMTVYDLENEYNLGAGEYCIARRNHLAKYIKHDSAEGKFKAVSVFFEQELLRSFAYEYGYKIEKPSDEGVIVKLRPNHFFNNYVQSLTPYLELSGTENEDIILLKKKELLLVLMRTNPELKDILFDFSDPGKIDLEAFMNQNFRFNVSMERFAYLTGRSLTTFKRDFEKIFTIPPGRWLLEKRLQEAHYLMQKKAYKASSVFREVGFEDLSHFSFAFKKSFGISPNQLRKTAREGQAEKPTGNYIM